MKDMEKRFRQLRSDRTRTAARVEFLRELLEEGMSKREAAHALSSVDPYLEKNSAETIVYMNFSGQYRTARRRAEVSAPVEKVDAPEDVEDDEGLL